MAFEGFSDADIIKLTQEESSLKDVNNVKKHKKVTFKINKNAAVLKEKIKLNENSQLPEKAKLEVSKPLEIENTTAHQNADTIPLSASEDKLPQNEIVNNNKLTESTKKTRDLQELQTRQKLMEEQNRKRKELLAKALADRTKRTQEEAQRLNEIQVELKKLDATLSNDVKILRKQIDLASVDYMEAQKKYLKVEKEFLDAKLYLQQKLEKKEMLTEHLSAIIEKNEERKAKKLTELLEKLKLDPKVIENETSSVVQISSSEAAKQ